VPFWVAPRSLNFAPPARASERAGRARTSRSRVWLLPFPPNLHTTVHCSRQEPTSDKVKSSRKEETLSYPQALSTVPNITAQCLTTQRPSLLERSRRERPNCLVCSHFKIWRLAQCPSNRLIVSRVKKIVAMDEDIAICSNNAAFVLTVAAVSRSWLLILISATPLNRCRRRCSSSTWQAPGMMLSRWTPNHEKIFNTRTLVCPLCLFN